MGSICSVSFIGDAMASATTDSILDPQEPCSVFTVSTGLRSPVAQPTASTRSIGIVLGRAPGLPVGIDDRVQRLLQR